jgi:hypothetical protein
MCVCVCVCVCVVKSFYILCIPLLLKKIYTKKKKIEDISPKAGYFSIWGLTDQGPSLNLGTHAYIHTHTHTHTHRVCPSWQVCPGRLGSLLIGMVGECATHTYTEVHTHGGGTYTHAHRDTCIHTHLLCSTLTHHVAVSELPRIDLPNRANTPFGRLHQKLG